MRLKTHALLALLVGCLGMESAMAIEEPRYNEIMVEVAAP
jgi:hypothetical protein